MSLLLLLAACPDDGGDNATDASSSTATTAATTAIGATGEPAVTDSSGPGNTSDPDSTSSSGATTMSDSTTGGGPTIACEDATTDEECTAAGSRETSCGWFPTRTFLLAEMMCMEVAQGGLCLPTSQGDDTCGLTLDASCMDADIVVYVRPAIDGAYETLQLGMSDACTGPDPGDGWELCVPAMMMEGCRCGCS